MTPTTVAHTKGHHEHLDDRILSIPVETEDIGARRHEVAVNLVRATGQVRGRVQVVLVVVGLHTVGHAARVNQRAGSSASLTDHQRVLSLRRDGHAVAVSQDGFVTDRLGRPR